MRSLRGGDVRVSDFDKWMRRVDQLAQQTWGLSIHDLPDVAWSDFFDDGLSPRQALVIYQQEEGM